MSVRKSVIDIRSVGTHEQIEVLNPLVRVEPPKIPGFPVGISESGTPFNLDLPMLAKLGYIDGTVGLIIGNKGSGKTSTMMQQAGFESQCVNPETGQRRRVSVQDTRENSDGEGNTVAEYTSFVEHHLGGTHVNLANYQMNILDPLMELSTIAQYDTIATLAEVVVGRRLLPREHAALTIGIEVMNRYMPKSTSPLMLMELMSTLHVSDYEQYIRERQSQLLDEVDDEAERNQVSSRFHGSLNTDAADFEAAAHTMSQILRRLTSGYNGIFGAANSLYELLTQPVVGVNMTALSKETIQLVEIVLWSWQAAALRVDCKISDENWERWSDITYGTNALKSFKHSRKHSTRDWRAMHNFDDLDQIVGVDQRNQAISALGVTDIVLVGRLPRSQHDKLQRYIRELSPGVLDRLPTLGKGQFLVLMGENWPPFFVQVLLSERQRQFSYTDRSRDRLVAGSGGALS